MRDIIDALRVDGALAKSRSSSKEELISPILLV
jgi:hypothetical protein